MPRYGAAARLERGELVEVLPELTCAPLEVSLVHAHGKQVPKRVRAVMTWIAEVLPITRARRGADGAGAGRAPG